MYQPDVLIVGLGLVGYVLGEWFSRVHNLNCLIRDQRNKKWNLRQLIKQINLIEILIT